MYFLNCIYSPYCKSILTFVSITSISDKLLLYYALVAMRSARCHQLAGARAIHLRALPPERYTITTYILILLTVAGMLRWLKPNECTQPQVTQPVTSGREPPTETEVSNVTNHYYSVIAFATSVSEGKRLKWLVVSQLELRISVRNILITLLFLYFVMECNV